MKYFKFAMFSLDRNPVLVIIAVVALVLVSFSAVAGDAYYSHEEVSGLNKICYYVGSGGTSAITIRAHLPCPGSIKV